MKIVTLPATDDYPHVIEIRCDDNGHIMDGLIEVDGAVVELTRYASDALFVAINQINENEQRIAYWRANIRSAVERLRAGEMKDEEPNAT